ncbi:hypothetical protein [Schleiferilactobacillus harbinensis]|nr:hypothetical protein [Schleiferilactobacillus harbinensis]GEK06393.1 hypothetical protein LHA01_16320 [Schleiferilactobacillus harbinensis]
MTLMRHAIATFFKVLLGANRSDRWTEIADENAQANIAKKRQENAEHKYR